MQDFNFFPMHLHLEAIFKWINLIFADYIFSLEIIITMVIILIMKQKILQCSPILLFKKAINKAL
jgi:hypothetical protein